MTDVTIILKEIASGAARTEDLLPLVYSELRRLAGAKLQHEPAGITLQATALVHEAFLRLVGDENATWENRRHFMGAAAIAMQRILVEQARQRQQLKRGGGRQQVELMDVAIEVNSQTSDADLLALNDALDEFQVQEPAKAELVRLRYFAGLSEEEAAEVLNISRATASRWRTFAKAWLYQRIQGAD
ncbi:MAG: ECF-type sigma factor [Fuerstiella sp.]